MPSDGNRIDSHHHFWQYSADQYPWISPAMSVLKQDFLESELRAACQPSGVRGVVSVQARQSIAESRWLLEIATASELVLGVVGWVDLAGPTEELEATLAELVQSPKFKAVRHVVQDEPDDHFLDGQNFNRGIRLLQPLGLKYDILVFARQLPSVIAFVDRHPQQPFVVDHIAKPTIESQRFDEAWASNLRELSKRPHVHCKFSGVVTEVVDNNWSLELIRPYWDVVLDCFGPDRLMFGSDWPVCLLRSTYEQWIELVEQLVTGSLSNDEQSRFWYRNALQFYGLEA